MLFNRALQRHRYMKQDSITPVDDFTSEDSNQIMQAIRTGCVDAFVVQERDGHAVYTLNSADLPYNTLVQRMQQGAAMLDRSGHIVYCNPSLGSLLGMTHEAMIGLDVLELVVPEDRTIFRELWGRTEDNREGDLRARRLDSSVISVRVSLTALSGDSSFTGLLVSDLTSEKSYAELASRIQHVQDEQQRKIARELHDSVGQLLAAIAMDLSQLDQEASGFSPASLDKISDCRAMIDEVSREIRTISHLLHPPLLDVAGLGSAIRWYVDGFSHRSQIKVDVQIDPEMGRLPGETEMCLFRIVQESLTNVYRHSGSDFCSITIRRDCERLHMEIRDTGKGFPDPGERGGTGLGFRGMKERLRLIGGTLEVRSTDSGTVVAVVVPLGSMPQQH